MEPEIEAHAKNIFVFSCTFDDLNKGAINLTIDNIIFLNSHCFFKNCSNSKVGGAIYFEGNSTVIQDRFCAIKSICYGPFSWNSGGLHSCTKLPDNSIKSSKIVESCIAQSVNPNGQATLFFYNGITEIYSTNISKNEANNYCGFSTLSDGESIIKYSTITNNTGRYYCILHSNQYLYQSSSTSRYCYCNNVDNKIEVQVYIKVWLDTTFQNCSFIFRSGPVGIHAAACNLFVVNCNFDCECAYISESSANITTQNIFTDENIMRLLHLSTYECEADYKLLERKKKTVAVDINYETFLFIANTMQNFLGKLS